MQKDGIRVTECGGVTSACVCLTLSTAWHVHVWIPLNYLSGSHGLINLLFTYLHIFVALREFHSDTLYLFTGVVVFKAFFFKNVSLTTRLQKRGIKGQFTQTTQSDILSVTPSGTWICRCFQFLCQYFEISGIYNILKASRLIHEKTNSN